MKTRTELINYLIKRYRYDRYLEIGVQNGVNFKAVNCKVKVGVDPDENTPATYHCTSNEFFETNKMNFDIVFIDGLHEECQVMQDVLNSITRLNRGGVIVMHDVNPQEEIHQRVPRESKVWNGDVWKAFIRLRRMGFNCMTVDIDHGCGVITLPVEHTYNENIALTYENLCKHRKEWLNLVSVTEFKELIELPSPIAKD